MMMNKYKRLNLNHMFKEHINDQQIVLMRTLYGNLYGGKSLGVSDVKHAGDKFDRDSWYLSSNDPSFKYEELGRFIRSKFPEPSPYELT
jgi:hypothetical protein